MNQEKHFLAAFMNNTYNGKKSGGNNLKIVNIVIIIIVYSINII